MLHIITTRDDIGTYIGNYTGLEGREDCARAQEYLATHPDRPRYGEDWSEWLDGVWPNVLEELARSDS